VATTIDISRREQAPQWLAWGAPFFAIIIALLAGAIALGFTEANPLEAYYLMFVSPLTNSSDIISIFERMIPLFLAGLAVYLPLKSGVWNIGVEAQFIAGGIIATWVAVSVQFPAILMLVMLIAGSLVGGLLGIIPGYLRATYGTNEIITTLLLSLIIIQVNEYVITGPLQTSQGFRASEAVPSAGRLPRLGEILPIDLSLNAGVLIALLLFAFAYVLMNYTRIGYEIEMVGSNPNAAGQGGIDPTKAIILTMALGGMVAGIAGFIELSGVRGQLVSGFSPGYGFLAIPIALLGRNGVTKVLLASFLFALLFVGSVTASTTLGISTSITEIISWLVILFLLILNFFKRFELTINSLHSKTEVQE
jgi:simple sugar transport system permease protein